MTSDLEQHILQLIQEKAGSAAGTLRFFPVGGGSINETYRVETDTGEKFFCKLNSCSKFPGLFEAEEKGLSLLGKQKLIRVPEVMGVSSVSDTQALLLEWIEQGMRTAQFWSLFGKQLAALHAVEEKMFGLETDNYMGALVQNNQPHADWNEFFIHSRLEPQLRLALDAGLLESKEAKQFEKLYQKLPGIFPSIRPCLLHGDLWSGNFLCDHKNRPVLIDPAVYFGHPSVDLGMTTLFGGFEKAFYESYDQILPFPPNYREQWEVCNLYPLLIHLNLFGESYKSAILHTVRRY